MEAQAGKYLVFQLDKDFFGIPVKKVKEIVGIMEITHVPKTKEHMKGVINLRGKIIPVIDLRLRLGLTEKAYNERTCVIVIELKANEVKLLNGIIVDMAAEVVNIQQTGIVPPSQSDSKIKNRFITGVGQLKERAILILDVEKVFNYEVMTGLMKETSAVLETKSLEN